MVLTMFIVTDATARAMGKRSNKCRTISQSDEVAEVLNIAKRHHWHLTYTSLSGGRRVSQETDLRQVDLPSQSLVLSSEMKYAGIQPGDMISFRVQSGGITMTFDSQLRAPDGNDLSNRLFADCRVEFPQTLVYTQLRQAVRFNCENIKHILVTFFDGQGGNLDGAVADISAGGVKVKLSGDLTREFRPSQTISDCRLLFPDASILEARVAVLGVIYDSDLDVSFARCCFMEMQKDHEIKLEERIHSMLERKDSLDEALG